MKNNSEYQNQLRAVSAVMTRIHKMMCDSEISDLEMKAGQSFSATSKLQALINAPELAWLRMLSQLMAAVDEVYFQKEPIQAEQVNHLLEAVTDLLINSKSPEFTANYRRLMTSLPDLMVQHAHLKTALKVKSSPS